MNYLNNAQTSRILKVRNSPIEIKKKEDFMPINLSIDDIDKFEEKEMTKKRTFEKTLRTIF